MPVHTEYRPSRVGAFGTDVQPSGRGGVVVVVEVRGGRVVDVGFVVSEPLLHAVRATATAMEQRTTPMRPNCFMGRASRLLRGLPRAGSPSPPLRWEDGPMNVTLPDQFCGPPNSANGGYTAGTLARYLGGVVEVLAYGVPPGLGSHVHWDRRIDGLLAQALMSIQAMKGVEIGDGFTTATQLGSEAHDEILWDAETNDYTRGSARAGGIEGGMTTGGLLVARLAMKPLATLNRPVLRTVDVETKEETVSFKERTDVTAVPASGVVAETMTALVLAGEALRKFGGDSLAEIVRNHDAYRASLS